jgi:hypothetical protein
VGGTWTRLVAANYAIFLLTRYKRQIITLTQHNLAGEADEYVHYTLQHVGQPCKLLFSTNAETVLHLTWHRQVADIGKARYEGSCEKSS